MEKGLEREEQNMDVPKADVPAAPSTIFAEETDCIVMKTIRALFQRNDLVNLFMTATTVVIKDWESFCSHELTLT